MRSQDNMKTCSWSILRLRRWDWGKEVSNKKSKELRLKSKEKMRFNLANMRKDSVSTAVLENKGHHQKLIWEHRRPTNHHQFRLDLKATLEPTRSYLVKIVSHSLTWECNLEMNLMIYNKKAFWKEATAMPTRIDLWSNSTNWYK